MNTVHHFLNNLIISLAIVTRFHFDLVLSISISGSIKLLILFWLIVAVSQIISSFLIVIFTARLSTYKVKNVWKNAC